MWVTCARDLSSGKFSGDADHFRLGWYGDAVLLGEPEEWLEHWMDAVEFVNNMCYLTSINCVCLLIRFYLNIHVKVLYIIVKVTILNIVIRNFFPKLVAWDRRWRVWGEQTWTRAAKFPSRKNRRCPFPIWQMLVGEETARSSWKNCRGWPQRLWNWQSNWGLWCQPQKNLDTADGCFRI